MVEIDEVILDLICMAAFILFLLGVYLCMLFL